MSARRYGRDRRELWRSRDCKVAVSDFELARGDNARPLDAGHCGGAEWADVCVRLHGEPLGVLRLAAEACAPRTIRRLAAERFADRAHLLIARWNVGTARWRSRDPVLDALHACSVEADSLASEVDTSQVTVVLCTRDRPHELVHALKSLVAAGYGAQLLVVDNSSDQSAARVCAHFHVRVVHEPRAGLDIARNRGVSESRTAIVAFTDDDAMVDERWVCTIAGAFARNPELSALTGLVLPASLETGAQRRFESYLGFSRGFERRWHQAPFSGDAPIVATHGNTGTLGTGANMAFRRSVVERIGGFDPALDAGTAAAGGGDLEIFFRVLKAGGLLAYEPAALVRHRHRSERAELESQIESWGTGMGASLASIAAAFPDEGVGARRLRRTLLMTWFARRWIDSLLRDRSRHELVSREIAGLKRGAELYHRSRRDRLAVRPFARLYEDSPHGRREANVDVHADRPLESLLGLYAPHVRVRAHLGGARIGDVVIDTVDGTVGADRLRDAIAGAFTARFAGTRELVRSAIVAGPAARSDGRTREPAGAPAARD